MNGFAYFVHFPARLEDLRRPFPYGDQVPYSVAATVTLAGIDYENFVTDLRVDRRFLEANAHHCRIDRDGVRHCLLVRRRGRSDGVLVLAGKGGYVLWAAYLPETAS